MEEQFRIEYDEQTGILFKYYYGPVSIQIIESSWLFAFENKLIPDKVKGFILDYRGGTFNLKTEEYIKIANFYKQYLEIFGNYKIAIITQRPKDVVIPILVEREDEGYSSKPFYSPEAAIEWILG